MRTEDRDKQPKALSPTPLRDWVERQPVKRRAGFIVLAALLIACGGQAGFYFDMSPVPATQQTFFALLSGALLGSRLGAVSAFLYLLGASFTGFMWPVGSGPTPMIGLLAGYLWSLPIVAFLSGYFVERVKSEQPVFFAIGACAAIAAYDVLGSMRLMIAQSVSAAEAVIRGSTFFVGQHFAQGALTVLIASSASSNLQARQKK